jgi:SAM-dependent methyltransferase
MLQFLRKVCDYAAYKFLRAPRGGGKPVPARALDAEYRSGHWDTFFGSEEEPRYTALLEMITRYHHRPRLLDVGCGSGRLAALLVPDRVETYTGLDLSLEGLNRARSLALSNAEFIHADFESWPGNGLRYDVIIFNESIGYARDPAQVARSFAAKLGPGGALIVSYYRSGNHEAIWRRLYRDFTFSDEKEVHNDTGLVWDLKVLQPRSAA